MTPPSRAPLTGLYVPADRPDRVAKALASSADVVIVDLEDAVHPAEKGRAREFLVAHLEHLMANSGRSAEGSVQMRINPRGSHWHLEDLRAAAELPRRVGVRIPKVENPAEVDAVSEHLPGRSLHVLLESALGVERAGEIAMRRIASIGLGEADLVSALGVENADMLSWQRARVVNAAAAAGLVPPWMSVYPRHRDLEGLRASCEAGRRTGFLGRAAIHPAQLPIIRDAFLPTPEERIRARLTLDALSAAEDSGAGVWVLEDGSFVDVAMIGWARRIDALSPDSGDAD